MSTTGNRNLRGPGRLRAACVATAGTVLAAVTPGAQAQTAKFTLTSPATFPPEQPPGVVQGRTDFGTAELLGLYGR